MGLSTIRPSATNSQSERGEASTDCGTDSASSLAASRTGRRKAEPTPHASIFYRNLTPAYEMVWPMVASRNIRDSIRRLKVAEGEQLLEVGVGTGLSLPHYPAHATVTGVDLSQEMLARAEERIEEQGWKHINVLPMNAEELHFPDASFDVVTSFHVVSVVSDPKKMMSEVARVCRPGGRILIVNHFRSSTPWIAKVVDSAGAVTRHLGWRTDVRLEDVVDGLPLRIELLRKPSPVSLFTIMQATRLA